MTSEIVEQNRELFREHTAEHYEEFVRRIEDVKRMLKAKDALLTVEGLNEITERPLKEAIPVEEITKLARYSVASHGREYKTGPLNESAVLLLSAYLEGFVEDLYEECLRHLLHENFKSARVLDVITKDTRRQFRNPSSGDIGGLFRKLTIDIASKFGPSFKCNEINNLVDARNKIAHGAKQDISDEKIERYLGCSRDFAEELTRELSAEVMALV